MEIDRVTVRRGQFGGARKAQDVKQVHIVEREHARGRFQRVRPDQGRGVRRGAIIAAGQFILLGRDDLVARGEVQRGRRSAGDGDLFGGVIGCAAATSQDAQA